MRLSPSQLALNQFCLYSTAGTLLSCSTAALMLARVAFMPSSISSSKLSSPPRRCLTMVADAHAVPVGGTVRRSVSRQPVGVGVTSNDHTLLLVRVRKAMASPGWMRTILEADGQRLRPCRFQFSE